MKKALALILVLVMLVGMMPMTAFATEKDHGRLSLEGLNVLCLGDSITAGQGLTTDTRWTNVLASKYGWNLTNKSQGGISLSSYYYTANGKSDVSIAKKAEILKTMTTKPDVIIVWGGHNDTSYRYSPLGTWDDETTGSFKGALKHIAELAAEYAPDATLFVLTPLWTTEAPSTLKVPENTTDNNWMFVDAIYEGADIYGWIPVNMDLCGITPFTKSGLLLDSIHPNEAGTEKIVEYLSEELACYGANSKIETIIFNKPAVSMKTGESTTLKAVQSPRSGNGSPVFTWSSSNSSVATVDANGKITAVAHGNATITATADNDVSATVQVYVAEGEHTYESTVTAPTCTEKGYTTYTCECGESYVADYVDALGHRWSSWQQIAEENCQGQGRWMRSCETCAAAQYTQDQEGSCVSFNSPAILANAGDTVVLTYYDVAFDADTVTDAATVAWSSDQLAVDQGCVTPTDPGVYTLVATSGAVSKTVYLVVKDPEDMEYVLYFDDFTDATLPGYRPIEVYSGARYYVSDGKLILDASNSANSYIRILLPEWIGNFGDYEIRTTFTMTEALDSTKWFAVMARVQNEDIPYLQAAARFNATAANGIELAKKDKDNNWVILGKTSYTEAISPSKYYTQTYGLSGTTGYHAINGTTLLKSDTMAYGPGDVGFQVRGAVASIDRIKIVIPVDTAAHTFGDWAVTTAPTCTEPGAEIRSCAVCGYTETRDVDPCHDLVQHAEKMHTCTESGWLAYETCTRCDYSTLVEVAPTDHSYQRRIHSVAHRGYSQTAPENTLVAYKLAKDKGYFYVECDVSFTADGIPVLLHDDTIDRTSDGTGKVAELTYEQLLQYDFGSWKSASYAGTRIPTFEEFIALCVELDLHPYIELKKSGSYTQAKIQQLVDIVEAYGMTGKVTWISFSSTFLGYVKNADTAARLGYVYSGDATQSTINVAKSLQTDSNEVFLDLKYSKLTNTGILRAATNGFAVEVWTVNSKRAILALPSYVSGVTSDGYHAQDIIDSNFSAVTAPTCTEQGYTTYTCACGDSYKSDYVDATGHTYKNGVCTLCGANQPGPVITQQAESVEQEIGKKFAITVKAEGEGLTYQWYYKDAGMKNFSKSSNRTSAYAYTMQSYMHNRQVYCVITDANGNSVQTETATITRPPMELTILQQPQDAQQEIGQKFSIKPTVQGDGLTYQWYYKDAGMKNFAKSSNRTSAYAYTMQSYMKGRQVYCVITDQYGNSVTTDVATISLPPVELKILEQPTDVFAAKGEKFSISAKVQGDGLTYQWYYKESYMKDFKPSSNRTSAYAYSMQNYMNGRSVYCVITDQYGNQITTEVVTLHMIK